ncbi:cell division protein SepF [Sphaerisporangium perillae]|uniref:cell division protein SepF n=1 Tax=Sphaerisporangium perillae TaxID=2935860 RepID=UPI00200BDD2B|nr:cell division protein SepF [Sphaerisporangium perillae]
MAEARTSGPDEHEFSRTYTGPRPDLALVKTLRPQDYNEALYVGHFFRKGLPVVMDLTGMSDADAKSLVDFAAGLVFGRRGDMDRIAHKVFLLVPHGMVISA